MAKDSEYPDMWQNYIVYEKIISRYQTLDFYINDKAAHELIDDPRLEDNRLQIRKNIIKKKFTRHELFKKNGVFAQSVESKIWDKNAASAGRILIAACDVGTISIKARFAELQDELKIFPYKFGILVIAIAETAQVAAMQDKIKSLVAQDLTGRMAFYLLKTPLTEEILDRWYNAVTYSELEQGNVELYREEAASIVEEWSGVAASENFMVVCGEKIYPSECGAKCFAAKLEREIIFGSIFTAAPELIVKTNTAFKKIQQSTILAGVKKNIPNAQFGNIVKALNQAGVWDMANLVSITRSTNTAIATVAKFLLRKFSRGKKIKLNNLWQKLQAAPYGYYNNRICGYILGFMLRHYAGNNFTWNRGDNNPWPLTEQNLAVMIDAMCNGEVVNNYLMPCTDIWREFKPYVQEIFQLTDEEAVNDIEARKFISRQCTEKVGVPFWALKYLPPENFGGVAAKKSAEEIINLLCDFMTETGNQEQVTENICLKLKSNDMCKTLTRLYFDRKTIGKAFVSFVCLKCAALKKLCKSGGLSEQDIFDGIHRLMQRQVSTWTESQVEEKLPTLCIKSRAAVDEKIKAAVEKIKTMPAAQLRRKILEVLNENPKLCKVFDL